MAEFIGSRISLVSKSDIRYVGTLHEINSETSTVALENVSSFGTEDRKPHDEMIPPSDNVYEYIVFRGSDVKDLRIEEAPGAKEDKPPLPPNDPAIMSSSGSRPPPQAQGQAQVQGQGQQRRTPQAQGPPQGQPPVSQAPAQNGPPYGHHPQYPPPFYAQPPAGWGRGGPPGPPFPGMPYGAPPPPGWYPPPGQGFPSPGPFPPYGYPPGPPGQQFQQGQQPPKPAPIGPGANKQNSTSTSEADKQHEPKSLAKPAAEMAAAAVTKAPSTQDSRKPPSSETKSSGAEQSAQVAAPPQTSTSTPKAASASLKTTRVQPVLPLKSPAASKAPLQAQSGNVASPAPQAQSASLRDATQAATAAVAAAMAKLPTVGQQNGSAMDNLTKKVNEMRTNEPIRAPRQPGTAAGFAPGRGGRGGRGGAPRTPGQAGQKVDVPATDFDFESSNAKFSKEDLVKEAIAGSPLGENPVVSPTEPEVPVTYNKSASFFDNISSESKDRADASGGRPGGREWRGEEQKKNVETFGQGSVDNGYRGGFRGRGGRGRGRGGFRGRGGYSGTGQPGQTRGGGYRGNADVNTQ